MEWDGMAGAPAGVPSDDFAALLSRLDDLEEAEDDDEDSEEDGEEDEEDPVQNLSPSRLLSPVRRGAFEGWEARPFPGGASAVKSGK